jgi:hypothetical protein
MELNKVKTYWTIIGIGLLVLSFIGIGLIVYGVISPDYSHADYVGYGIVMAGGSGGPAIAFLIRVKQIKIQPSDQFKGENKI